MLLLLNPLDYSCIQVFRLTCDSSGLSLPYTLIPCCSCVIKFTTSANAFVSVKMWIFYSSFLTKLVFHCDKFPFRAASLPLNNKSYAKVYSFRCHFYPGELNSCKQHWWRKRAATTPSYKRNNYHQQFQ